MEGEEDTKVVEAPSNKDVLWERGNLVPPPRRCSKLPMVGSPSRAVITHNSTSITTINTISIINNTIIHKEDHLTEDRLLIMRLTHTICHTDNKLLIAEGRAALAGGSHQVILPKEAFIILLRMLLFQLALLPQHPPLCSLQSPEKRSPWSLRYVSFLRRADVGISVLF